jgi:hypothetical protein
VNLNATAWLATPLSPAPLVRPSILFCYRTDSSSCGIVVDSNVANEGTTRNRTIQVQCTRFPTCIGIGDDEDCCA